MRPGWIIIAVSSLLFAPVNLVAQTRSLDVIERILPSDTEAVIHLNVEALVDHPLLRKAVPQLVAKHYLTFARFAALATKSSGKFFANEANIRRVLEDPAEAPRWMNLMTAYCKNMVIALTNVDSTQNATPAFAIWTGKWDAPTVESMMTLLSIHSPGQSQVYKDGSRKYFRFQSTEQKAAMWIAFRGNDTLVMLHVLEGLEGKPVPAKAGARMRELTKRLDLKAIAGLAVSKSREGRSGLVQLSLTKELRLDFDLMGQSEEDVNKGAAELQQVSYALLTQWADWNEILRDPLLAAAKRANLQPNGKTLTGSVSLTSAELDDLLGHFSHR
jgi:hypothetical protein